MEKTFAERSVDAERGGYADFSTNVETRHPPGGRDSVEDRTTAELLRRDGVTDGEIEKRFGYIPTPMRAAMRRGNPETATTGRPVAPILSRRRTMEPG